MPTTTTITHTTHGTPCARTWSADWIATINAKETELNTRICGARLPGATPCTNTSNHPTGRCPHHGGFDLTGAPPGNRNHTIHGLYSRRLRTCTPNCPHWQTCPLANATYGATIHSNPANQPGPALDSTVNPKLKIQNPKFLTSLPSIPPTAPTDPTHSSPNPKSKIENPKFPALICPYQQLEYNTVLTDALAIVESQPHPNPMGIHTAHNVALLQVLISNAATHFTTGVTGDTGARASRPCNFPPPPSSTDSTAPNVEVGETLYPTPDSRFPTIPDPLNPNATLAFIRLMREFRASLKMLAAPLHPPLNRQKQNTTHPTPESIQRHIQRIQHDTQLDPDSIAESQLEPQTATTHARAYLQQAILAGSQGRDVEMCEAFDTAAQLDEPLAESERDHVLASYRPPKQTISEELAQQILGNLHLPPLPDKSLPEKEEPTLTSDPRDQEMHPENASILNEYLTLFRDGKIPPEAFPINSPIRTHTESKFAGKLP